DVGLAHVGLAHCVCIAQLAWSIGFGSSASADLKHYDRHCSKVFSLHVIIQGDVLWANVGVSVIAVSMAVAVAVERAAIESGCTTTVVCHASAQPYREVSF
ncbi:hypothetical protein Vretifemale_12077, partial [Volvox reticuliferus]